MSGGGGTISTSEPRLGALRVQQSSYGLALPIVYGRTRVGGNLVWYGDFVAIAHTTTTSGGGKGGGGVSQQNTTYTYEAAIMMALCEGPIGGVVSIWQAKKRFESSGTQTAVEQLGLSFAPGTAGQPKWSHLSTSHPAQALGYSSTAHLHSAAFSLGANAEIDNHSFELDAKLQFGNGIVDANPKDIVHDLLTNPQYGAAFPADSMGDMSVYGSYCQAMGLFLSPAFTEQQEAREHLKLLTSMTNSACVWSEAKLKIVPYGDETITGNGATYTPNLTPIYDLTDDDFIVTGAEDPVKCDRKTPADAFNQVQIEYLNRANAYNLEIAEAKDQANIEKFGLRPRDPIKMHGICDATVARRAAQLQLQRSLYVRNEYEFRLGWKYCLLEPMDLVTLTDEGLGLDRTPVRIIDVQEDADGLLTLRAEDYPFGVASATLYPTQSGSGFAADYNAAPGNVATPVFFEPPIEMATTTGLEVWCAVSGLAGSAGRLWGGCHVWASLDGSTYKQVGTVRGGARYGTLTTSLASGGTSMGVSLAGRGGQMLAGTAQDASLLNTLCWVGTPAGGEYVAHTTATLTAANAYTLGGLVRGAYTTPVVAHGSGQQFVRVDEAICKGDPLDVAMIGQPVYFKFCSFNAYGGGLQALADVDAYQYTPTGSMLKLPPSNVTGLSIQIEGNGVRVSWSACPDVDYDSTIVRVGTSWATGTEVANKSATSHLLGWQLAGPLKVWAAHVDDNYGNVSDAPSSATLMITSPSPVLGLALACDTTGLAASWTMPALAATEQPIDRVELSWSVNFATIIQSTKATSVPLPWVTPGFKELFVRAVDMAGNIGTSTVATLVVRSPSAPVGLAVTIGTTGAVVSWGAPAVASDQQPLGGVQLSYFADFSNVIETRSATSVELGWLTEGTRTLYARYTDVAGNSGSAASVAFTVAAPSAPASLQIGFGNSSIEAAWQAPTVAAQQQSLERVELSWGSAFTSIIDGRKATTTTFGWLPAGTHTLHARYVDMAGNVGAVSQATLQVLAPAQVVMTAVETQVNLVTLRWQDAKTSQPIRKYAIYYGEAGTLVAASALYGSAGADSRSDILQYRSSGAKVAYLVAEDVAGNVGAARQIDLNIKMPDNFVLATEYYEDWQPSELTNGTIVGGPTGQIILPAYDGRTWGQRLSNNGWATAQQKVDAGFPIVVQPVPASGKHVERKDCGKLIATSVVRVTPTVLGSSVAGYTPTIRIRASVGASTTNWQPWLVGESASFSDFQHVEVEYSVVSDSKGFVVLDDLYVKVEVAEVTESATLVLDPAAAAGTAYTCTKPFLDVRAVQVTPVGANSMARPPYYVIDDSTLPAKVYVFAHDASNARTGGTVSLFITGV